jgi:hypothetical protein
MEHAIRHEKIPPGKRCRTRLETARAAAAFIHAFIHIARIVKSPPL